MFSSNQCLIKSNYLQTPLEPATANGLNSIKLFYTRNQCFLKCMVNIQIQAVCLQIILKQLRAIFDIRKGIEFSDYLVKLSRPDCSWKGYYSVIISLVISCHVIF